MSLPQPVQERVADGAAFISGSSVVFGWLNAANEVAQFIATCIAIVSGVLAIAWHVWKFINRNKVGSRVE